MNTLLCSVRDYFDGENRHSCVNHERYRRCNRPYNLLDDESLSLAAAGKAEGSPIIMDRTQVKKACRRAMTDRTSGSLFLSLCCMDPAAALYAQPVFLFYGRQISVAAIGLVQSFVIGSIGRWFIFSRDAGEIIPIVPRVSRLVYSSVSLCHRGALLGNLRSGPYMNSIPSADRTTDKSKRRNHL